MALDPLTAGIELASKLGGSLIDKLFPDKIAQANERARAELALVEVRQSGEIQLIQQQLSAIIAEAQSNDPWTSRARPTFMYVIYIMILIGIPMGVLSAFKPEMAAQIAAGLGHWLNAIPDALWALFGAGYLGYTGARMLEKNAETKATK